MLTFFAHWFMITATSVEVKLGDTSDDHVRSFYGNGAGHVIRNVGVVLLLSVSNVTHLCNSG